MDAPKGMEVDHVDRDGLNNQRANLRLYTRVPNQQKQLRDSLMSDLSLKEIADMTDIPLVSLSAMARQGSIPAFQLNKHRGYTMRRTDYVA